jgi:hypothetical protein
VGSWQQGGADYIFSTGLIGFKGLIIFTATSLRQGYGSQEERKDRREKIAQSMKKILKILFILSKKLLCVLCGKNSSYRRLQHWENRHLPRRLVTA